MRLLVLGGTVFLSRAVAEDAVARGHEVTCACRGASGAVPDGADLVRWDRADPVPGDLTGREFDAVVDVGRVPSQVRSAVEAFPAPHWVFVSTISVYADHSRPGGTPDTLPLLEPIHEDADWTASPETYGGLKVACEQLVTRGARSSVVVRPGLIVGPGDPSGRFAYWPRRLAAGGEVLAPGGHDDPVQVIDVRDLGAWVVDLAEQRRTGVLEGTGHVTSRAELLESAAAAVGSRPRLTWVPQEFLLDHGVEPWSGPRSLPLWLPLPEYAGMMSHDVSASYAAGLRTRSPEETTRDTLAWLEASPDAPVTGMSREEERELLAAWHEAAAAEHR